LRPAPNWFAEPSERPRPFGVDAASTIDAPFEVDAPFSIAAPVDIDAGTATRSTTSAHQFKSPEPVPTAVPARRTVRIQGRGAERNLPVTVRGPYGTAPKRRRSSLLDHTSGFEPDRLAMWAMLLGVALVAVAILSSSF
jgi:hypothetical protein